MSEWKEYRLGDIITIKSGFAYKGDMIGHGENVLLGMGCVSFKERFLLSGARAYAGDCADRYCANSGDIVLATRQQSDNLPILGMPAIIPSELSEKRIIIGANLYRVDNESDFSNEYIYWLLKTPLYVNHIRSCQSGTTVRMITKANIEDFRFKAPGREERNRISCFLKTLDDKIEVNRRINDNLEQQAQALFKSWFVDFEPFRNQPFTESELGMIPEGWSVGTVGELIEIKYGKDHKKMLDGEIPVYGSGGLMRRCERALYNGESVLIPRKGTLNNVMYVNGAFWTVDTMFYSVPKIANVILFTYLFLCSKDLASMNSGSAVPSMTTEILNNMQIVVPTEGVMADFNTKVRSIYSQIRHGNEESGRLASLRDTLLPRLMSGEIKVEDVTL